MNFTSSVHGSGITPAVRTNFLCDYLASEELRTEINNDLQVVEQWNSANEKIFYGKNSDLVDPDREHVEVSALALHLLQSVLVYVNTILLQRILAEPAWRDRLTEHDWRALTPLFWDHANLYGRFELDMTIHLDLGPRELTT